MIITKIGQNSLTKIWIRSWIKRILAFATILLIFLFSLDLMVQSLALLGTGFAKELLEVAEMPFIALFIGLLMTALLQSSSTVTSMAVAMVASQAISLSSGIYIIMGANIGTTITSNIVSLGFITDRHAFRKAISAAVIHDFFNFFTTFLVFPLEYYYGLLSKTVNSIAALFNISKNTPNLNFNNSGNFIFEPVTDAIIGIGLNPWILLILSIVMIFISIKMFANFSFRLLIGGSKDKMQSFIFNKPGKSFFWGMLLTGSIQSSSITTSLVVPLVAMRKVFLKSVFPFILGANIGTTITAIIAALYKSETALALAIAHLLINIFGVLLVLPFAGFRNMFVKLAEEFGSAASKNRIIGFIYIVLAFFIIPFLLIYFSRF